MKSDTKTRNTKKTIVRMLAAMLIGGVIGGVSTVVYEIVFGEDFSGIAEPSDGSDTEAYGSRAPVSACRFNCSI